MRKLSTLLFLVLAGCATSQPIAFLQDPSPQRKPATADEVERECKQANGRLDANSKDCVCGTRRFTALYENCVDGKVLPSHIQKIAHQSVNGAAEYVEKGMGYKLLNKQYVVATFENKQVCYGEISYGRVNDDRVMPGGGGDGGGRIACFAVNSVCPALRDCLIESSEAGTNSELSRAMMEAKWVYDSVGPFDDRKQLAADQERGEFTCYLPANKQTKIFKTTSQAVACSDCMFWGRDEVQAPYPDFVCTSCDSDEAMKANAGRRCP